MRTRKVYWIIGVVSLLLALLYAVSPDNNTMYYQRLFALKVATGVKQRSRVAEDLLKNGMTKLGKIETSRDDLGPKTDYFLIAENGTIISYNEQYKVLIIYEPRIENKIVRWSCTGYPKYAVAIICQ